MEKGRSAAEIVWICYEMKPGDNLFFPEGNFYVDRFESNYRIFTKGGDTHYSGKAINLRPHIQKAIKRKKEIEKQIREQSK